jgi:hypothetical protein
VKNSAIPKNSSILAVCGIHHRASLKETCWLTEMTLLRLRVTLLRLRMTLLRLRMTLLGVIELNREEMK